MGGAWVIEADEAEPPDPPADAIEEHGARAVEESEDLTELLRGDLKVVIGGVQQRREILDPPDRIASDPEGEKGCEQVGDAPDPARPHRDKSSGQSRQND